MQFQRSSQTVHINVEMQSPHRRNISTRFVLLAMLLLVAVAQSQAFHKAKFCGSKLNQVLDLVCVKGFYSKLQNYEDNNSIEDGNNSLADEPTLKRCTLQEILSGKPCGGSGHVTALFEQRRQQRRRRQISEGIVHECCQTGCDYTDILYYCV